MTNIDTCMKNVDCCVENQSSQKAFLDFINKITKRIKSAYESYHQRRIDRDAFSSLLQLDEKSLKDIGVSRNDILWASKLAMRENASKELEKVRAQNIATSRLFTTQHVQRRKR